jgi:LmbE family N-acetylglucosaminyl deacetylase
MRRSLHLAGLALCLVALAARAAEAPAPAGERPTVLVVTAHPDDDALFSATIYKVTHALGGVVDLAVVTNGEGGYRYSLLAEPIYGLRLTEESVGRAHLPGIRKRELLAGGAIVGIRNVFFLEQLDSAYTLDMSRIFGGEWDVAEVRRRLGEILARGRYGFLFLMLPTESTHAAHRASAILALEAVQAMPEADRPLALGGTVRLDGSPEPPPFAGLDGHPITRIRPGAQVFEFDRNQKFGFEGRLDYNIIADWVIAEHKSQGTMQLLAGRQAVERYLYFDLNPESGLGRTRAFFDRLLAAPPFLRSEP